MCKSIWSDDGGIKSSAPFMDSSKFETFLLSLSSENFVKRTVVGLHGKYTMVICRYVCIIGMKIKESENYTSVGIKLNLK